MSEDFNFEIIKQLDQCAELFTNKSSAISYEAKTSYKKFKEVLSHDVDIFYNNHIVRFSYYPHLLLSSTHSVLTCYIALSKTDPKKVFFPLASIYGFLDIIADSALTIPMILTPSSMRECFDCLSSSLYENHSQIADLSYNQAQKAALFDSELENSNIFADIYYGDTPPTNDEIEDEIREIGEKEYKSWKEKVYGVSLSPEEEEEAKASFNKTISQIINDKTEKIFDKKLAALASYFELALARSLSKGGEAYMVGDYKTALKDMTKIAHKTQYEKLLINFMKNEKSPKKHVPEEIYETLTKLYKNGIQKTSLKEGLAFALSSFILSLAWAPIFFGLFFVFCFFVSRDSIFLLGPLDNWPIAIIPCFFMGMITVFLKSEKFYKIFFKKDYQKLIALQTATIPSSSIKFVKALRLIILIASALIFLIFANLNLKLTENGFYDNRDFLTFNGAFYKYEEVDKLCYQKDLYDKEGNIVASSSYFILLKNGEKIELSQFDSFNEKFLEILKNKNIEIEPIP